MPIKPYKKLEIQRPNFRKLEGYFHPKEPRKFKKLNFPYTIYRSKFSQNPNNKTFRYLLFVSLSLSQSFESRSLLTILSIFRDSQIRSPNLFEPLTKCNSKIYFRGNLSPRISLWNCLVLHRRDFTLLHVKQFLQWIIQNMMRLTHRCPFATQKKR